MENNLGIKAISTLTGISAYTLRYYEKNGLIHAINRDASGRRQYSSSDLGWIQFLVRLRATGMSIRQMQQIANLRRQGLSTAKERRLLLEEHQQKVASHIVKLQEHMDAIVVKIQDYRQWEAQFEQKEESK